MKILHLTTHLNSGGVTSYLRTLLSQLKKDGHEVAVLSSGGERASIFEIQGIATYTFDIKTKNEWHPKLFWQLSGIASLIKKEQFELIHAHSRVTQILAAMLSGLTGVPYVTTCHGFFKRRFGRKLFPAWGKRVIAISDLVAEDLQKTHKVAKTNIRIIYNGMDIAQFRKKIALKDPDEMKKKFSITKDAFVVGSISRLVQDKGHAYLLEAAALVIKKYPHTHFLIAGDGREKKRLQKLAAKLHLNKHLTMIDSIEDVTEIYSILDVFVQPATHREGFGLTLLESMAAKIPMIASDIWAINSIIRNRVNGILVAPKHSKELAAAIVDIIEHPENAGTFAENAYENALRLYGADTMAREVETMYMEVIRK